MIATAPLLALIAVTCLGAFSRFTHGRYFASFYRYQLERAPDNHSTRYIPFVDLLLAVLLIFPRTRALAASLFTFFQGIGVVIRIKDGKSPVPDIALVSIAAFTAWSSWISSGTAP